MLLSREDLVQLAARNNAEWCDIVCGANGAPGNFEAGLWSNVYKVPMYYANIVTLNREMGWEQLKPIIVKMPKPMSIKDSFNNLDLTSKGFMKLFEAKWLLAPENVHAALPFTTLQNTDQLKQWELAWSEGEITGLFTNVILTNPVVRFIAVYHQEQIIAGAIANKSKEVIGLSNFFCKAAEPATYWLTCVAAAQTLNPDWPVVGYAVRDSLNLLQSIKFTELGSLAVWLKN